MYAFEDKRCYRRIPIIYKNNVHFFDTLSRRTYFWETPVLCGSESISIYSKLDIQHQIRTQQFQELLTKTDTIRRQPIDQNSRKLAERAGFSYIYAHNFSGYFKDSRDYICLNGEKYRPQDIPQSIFLVL